MCSLVTNEADAGFAFGNCRESDSGAENACVEECAAELHGLAAVADDDGRDGSFSGGRVDATDVEARAFQFILQ